EITKQLPGHRERLTGEEFNAIYGADPSDLKAAADWARANSLQVVDESVPKRRLLVRGTIDAMQKAFGTELNEYEHPQQGRFRGREGDLLVSNELAGVVTGVFGLDTRKVGHSRMRRIPGRSASVQELLEAHKSGSKLTNKWPGTFFPPQVAQLYQYPQ